MEKLILTVEINKMRGQAEHSLLFASLLCIERDHVPEGPTLVIDCILELWDKTNPSFFTCICHSQLEKSQIEKIDY